jgi:hypothetical protein
MNRFDPSEECLQFQDVFEKNLDQNSLASLGTSFEKNSFSEPSVPSNVTPFLSHQEMLLLSSHPNVCEACRNYQMNYQKMLTHLKSVPAPTLSDDFTQQLMNKLEIDKLEKEQGMEVPSTSQSLTSQHQSNTSNVVPFPHPLQHAENETLSNETIPNLVPASSQWKMGTFAWVATFLILAVSTVVLLQKDFQYNPTPSSAEVASAPGSPSQSTTLGMPSAYNAPEATASPSNDSKISNTKLSSPDKALPKANTSIDSAAKNKKGSIPPAKVPTSATGSVEMAPVDRLIAMADEDSIVNTPLPGEMTLSKNETSSPEFMTHYVGF